MNLKEIKEVEIIENTMIHFPEDISEDIHDYVINDVLKDSRYIFTTRKGKKQFGYCTHCKEEYETCALKHKEESKCIKCGSKCIVQSSGMGRKYMVDSAYFVYYEKSQANEKAMIARGFEVSMDFSGEYRNVDPKLQTMARYLFEMDNPVFIKTASLNGTEKLELRKSTFTLFTEYGLFGMPSKKKQEVSIESIKRAVAGTQFQYSMWDYNGHANELSSYLDDYVSYFALYARHPQIEYLIKLGFKEFVNKKLNNITTYRTINWNGKTIDKVLKVPKQSLKDVLKYAKSIDPFVLLIYQMGIKDGSNFSIEEALIIQEERLELEFERIKAVIKNIRFRKLINYLNKQMQEDAEIDPEQVIFEYVNLREVFIMLQDYWSGCNSLELEVGKDIPEYPRDLQASHDNVYKQIEYKENKELDEKIKERYEVLSKFEYENEMFILRPFSSTAELIKEGKALKHCVGRYAKKYAHGSTDLFAIRKKEDPNKPFYTMELADGEVRQYYGYKNNRRTKKSGDVIKFVEEFEKDVIKKVV